ncbi:hypothetical protein D3C72_2204040 [compost metagenome]
MIWSSRLELVPPTLVLPGVALAAAMNSLAFLAGFAALVHNTNSSCAIIATGVRSRQLKGRLLTIGTV